MGLLCKLSFTAREPFSGKRFDYRDAHFSLQPDIALSSSRGHAVDAGMHPQKAVASNPVFFVSATGAADGAERPGDGGAVDRQQRLRQQMVVRPLASLCLLSLSAQSVHLCTQLPSRPAPQAGLRLPDHGVQS